MLFNTFSFCLVFLPLALLGYFVLSTLSLRPSIVFLLLASVAFYAYWDISLLPLLLASISVNYFIGKWISREREAQTNRHRKLPLFLGLIFNLGLLAFFKYFDFLIANLAWLTGTDLKPLGITLPIGISFFTFTQIAYLADCYAAQVSRYKLETYALFVTYFPHLIAGPILHHKEMMPQFERVESHVFTRGRLCVGMMFFSIGLFKKIVLADGVGRFVGPVFDTNFEHLTILEAWCGALAYTFQLYFDFSAYCDMAYGLSYMFGIILPINFNSPYKACSIVDFWRRWHITLSTFLREYLYIPLGGNRHGGARRYINLMVTMLLGGLWHGANWTFVAWGALHGTYLMINHSIRYLGGERNSAGVRLLGRVVTFLAVVVAWVFFRASSLNVALEVVQAMSIGTFRGDSGASIFDTNRIMAMDECVWWLVACALISFFMPNAYELIGRGVRRREETRYDQSLGAVVLGALLVLILFLLIVGETRGVSEFLYFNF